MDESRPKPKTQGEAFGVRRSAFGKHYSGGLTRTRQALARARFARPAGEARGLQHHRAQRVYRGVHSRSNLPLSQSLGATPDAAQGRTTPTDTQEAEANTARARSKPATASWFPHDAEGRLVPPRPFACESDARRMRQIRKRCSIHGDGRGGPSGAGSLRSRTVCARRARGFVISPVDAIDPFLRIGIKRDIGNFQGDRGIRTS